MKIIIEVLGENDITAWFTEDVNNIDSGYSTRGTVSQVLVEVIDALLTL